MLKLTPVRIVLVVVPGVIPSRLSGFQLRWLWYISVASVLAELALAFRLLRREFSQPLA